MSFAEGPAPDPVVAPPPPRPPSSLFGGIAHENLSLGTAIEVAFRALAKPAFVLPILVISVVVNAILEATLLPALRESITVSPTGQPTIENFDALVGPIALSFLITTLGSIVASVYGQVWAVLASVGPLPTMGETLQVAARRWVGVLGASLLVGLMTMGTVLIGIVVLRVLADLSPAIAFGVAVGLVIVFIWFIARMSMAPWLAADGGGVVESVQGSWRITEGGVLRILGWLIAYGFLFALLAGALGIVLGRIPYIGSGIGQGLTLALGYGAGVVLYRRTQAAAPPPPSQSSAPPASGTPVG